MLRRGLAALLMGVICAGSVVADDSARGHKTELRTGGLIGWLKQKTGSTEHKSVPAKPTAGGVQRAVVNDAERQSAQIPVNQTSVASQDEIVVVGEASPEPIIIRQVPQVPTSSQLTVPQNVGATASTGFTNPVPVYPGQNWQQSPSPVPVRAASMGQFAPAAMAAQSPVPQGASGPNTQHGSGGYYPQTGAALYPAPIPGIPQQIGGTMIQNPAFHPHEMLYAHRYTAMYPPYYYKVNGGWMVTPFGVWSHEDWKLQGTTVDVKYHSQISPFSLFHGRSH